MAQKLVTVNGSTSLPGAYFDIQVQQAPSGLATTGVLALLGEADAGIDYSLETDLNAAFFGPDQVSDVVAKYKSGPLVDAFRAAADAANDSDITGSPQAIYLIKTNSSAQASQGLLRAGLTNYALLADKSRGALGNLLYASVLADTAEVAPTTGSVTYIPTPSGATLALRVNGGAKQTLAVSTKESPTTLVGSITSGASTGLSSLSGISATGGVNRSALGGVALSATLAVVASGSNVTITLAGGTFGTTPSVGDTLLIPVSGEYGAAEDSCIKGSASANAGAYVVTGAGSTTITATKLRNNASGALTSPVNVSATALGSEATDILAFAPVVVQNATGTNRGVLTGLVTQTITGTATAQSLKLVLATGQVWAATAQVGDLVLLPSTAPSAWHASGANGGWYQVTAAGSGTAAGASYITMTRLSNGAPANFAATAIAAMTDLQVLRPAIDGVGKALELYDAGGADNVNTLFYALSSTLAPILSTSNAPLLLTSASEYVAELSVSRQSDGTQETIIAGGDIALKLGYLGTTATAVISGTTLTTTVTGGSGANLSINLKSFKTIADLANYINAQTGYVCTVGSVLLGQMPVVSNGASVLDAATLTIATDLGAQPGRLKLDAFDFFNAVSTQSQVIQLGATPAQAAAGLPEVQATFYLSGGARGPTTAAGFVSAVAACEQLTLNSVIPLFSRDATADIADGLTDSASTYQIDSINAVVKSHVLAMSTFKRRRNRQGFLSKRTSFINAQLAANNLASYRCSLTFQDFKTVGSDGTITQFQPWMGAVLAAAMQAAGGYRSILFKGINCSGVVMFDGSFSDTDDTDLEDAIDNGLLVAQRAPGGGFRWNSDQTTYAIDDNFVYNSIQAIYGADTVALTTAQKLEKAFVGKSLADVSASVALSYLKGIMSELKRTKWIVGDDSAPLGFLNAVIKISGNTMKVSLTIKLATAIVFIPVSFLVNEVQSSAAQ